MRANIQAAVAEALAVLMAAAGLLLLLPGTCRMAKA